MIATLLLWLIRAYQLTLSPILGRVCRFEPSCSRYAAACIAGHGAGRGSLLSFRRLCKCHPFHPGGYDPPPQPRIEAAAARSTPFSPAPSGPSPHAGAHAPLLKAPSNGS